MDELYARIAAALTRQKRVLRVGLDLDGCFFWFHQSYVNGCKAIGELPAGHPGLTEPIYAFYEQLGHSLDRYLNNCHRLADLGLLWSGPIIPGSATVWDTILSAGHEVHVITDRTFGTHPIASEVGTRLWLAVHDRPFHSLTFTSDKTSVETDVMIEDKIANYDALAATTSTPYLINRPWNLDPGDHRRRVENHDEFLLEVLLLGADTTNQVRPALGSAA